MSHAWASFQGWCGDNSWKATCLLPTACGRSWQVNHPWWQQQQEVPLKILGKGKENQSAVAGDRWPSQCSSGADESLGVGQLVGLMLVQRISCCKYLIFVFILFVSEVYQSPILHLWWPHSASKPVSSITKGIQRYWRWITPMFSVSVSWAFCSTREA